MLFIQICCWKYFLRNKVTNFLEGFGSWSAVSTMRKCCFSISAFLKLWYHQSIQESQINFDPCGSESRSDTRTNDQFMVWLNTVSDIVIHNFTTMGMPVIFWHLPGKQCLVLDPDPCKSVLKWLPWIRIRIGNTDLDPDPGQSKWCKKRK